MAAPARGCPTAHQDATQDFELLVARHWSRVYALAYRLMRDRQDAEDQTQEVFLKVYRRLGTLDQPAALTSWILRITTNTCYDALERQRRYPPIVPLAPDDSDAAHTLAHTRLPQPEEAAVRTEERGYLALSLAQLDGSARQVLILRDIEGRSYEEIAEILSLGMSAVKMRIRRARLAFQQALDRICPDLKPASHG